MNEHEFVCVRTSLAPMSLFSRQVLASWHATNLPTVVANGASIFDTEAVVSQSFVLQQSQLKVQSSMSCADTLVQAREVYQCWFEEAGGRRASRRVDYCYNYPCRPRRPLEQRNSLIRTGEPKRRASANHQGWARHTASVTSAHARIVSRSIQCAPVAHLQLQLSTWPSCVVFS
jgi:hypothetical protein